MEVLKPTAQADYYSQGLRARFKIDAVERAHRDPPPVPSLNIGYTPDEQTYRILSTRRVQAGGLETEVPYGWPAQLSGPLVWHPEDFTEEDYVFRLTADDKSEISRALSHFKTLGIDDDTVSEATFPLPVLSQRLKIACRQVYDGCGFVILRGLEPDSYSTADFTVVYLGVSSYIAERRGRQDERGSMLMHVMRRNDEAKDAKYCADQPFHTDTVTDVLGLVTVNCSKRGGSSILSPAWTMYNDLAATRPDLIHTLAKADWPFDTYGRSPLYHKRALMYYHHDKLILSFSRRLLVGHEPFYPRTKGIPVLNEAQAEAIDAMHYTSKKYQLKTSMEKGDIRFINNMAVLHCREAFEDEGDSNRHLVRMWLNNELMCWKLPLPLQLAWARVFEDEDRQAHWDIAPVRESDGTLSRIAGSCD